MIDPAALARIPFVSLAATWNNGRYDLALGVVPLAWLAPAAYNPRTMTADSRERLEHGLDAFGLVDTLVACEDGHLLGGHQRLVSEQRRGATHAPVCVVFGLSIDQRVSVNILLNNDKAAGDYDMPKLTALLSELDAHGFDATLTGFWTTDLERLLAPEVEDEPTGADASDEHENRPCILVQCRDFTDQALLLAKFTADGLRVDACTVDPTVVLKRK